MSACSILVCYPRKFQNDATVCSCQTQQQEGTTKGSLVHGTVRLAQGRVRAAKHSCAQLESAPPPFTAVTTISAFTTAECGREGLVSQMVTSPVLTFRKFIALGHFKGRYHPPSLLLQGTRALPSKTTKSP